MVDGRALERDGEGFWIGPTLIDNVTTDMSVYTDEILGPVLAVVRVPTLDAAIDLINANPYANGTAIFTGSGRLAAGQDRAGRTHAARRGARPRRGRACMLSGAERTRASRADRFGVERVGLPAPAGAIGPRRAVRADIADVMVASGAKRGGLPAPAAGVLHTPARDRPERARPRLKRSVALARDPEMLSGHQSGTRVDDGRRQRALVRIDPDHVAGVIGREHQLRGPGAAALASGHHALPARPATRDTVARPTTSRWAREPARTPLSGQADRDSTSQGRHLV